MIRLINNDNTPGKGNPWMAFGGLVLLLVVGTVSSTLIRSATNKRGVVISDEEDCRRFRFVGLMMLLIAWL
jgi:hypothetical protein